MTLILDGEVMSELEKRQDLKRVRVRRVVCTIFEVAFFIAAIASLFYWDIALFVANLAMSGVCGHSKDVITLAVLVKYGGHYE